MEGAEFLAWVKVGTKSLNGNENNVMLRNLGGAVPELTDAAFVNGTDRKEDGRGVGIIDVEPDGDLDLVVQSVEKPAVLLINEGASGHWLQIRLTGTRSNRDAIGARVEVQIGGRVLMREVSSTGGFISGQSLLCHFGLGEATQADEVRVHWPLGGTTRMENVAADQVLRIKESGVPVP